MAGKASVRGSMVFQGVMGWKLLWVSPVKVWGKNNRAYQKKTGSLSVPNKIAFPSTCSICFIIH